MKALLLMLIGAAVIAISFVNIGTLGGLAFPLILVGAGLGFWGLIANHRDHTR